MTCLFCKDSECYGPCYSFCACAHCWRGWQTPFRTRLWNRLCHWYRDTVGLEKPRHVLMPEDQEGRALGLYIGLKLSRRLNEVGRTTLPGDTADWVEQELNTDFELLGRAERISIQVLTHPDGTPFYAWEIYDGTRNQQRQSSEDDACLHVN